MGGQNKPFWGLSSPRQKARAFEFCFAAKFTCPPFLKTIYNYTKICYNFYMKNEILSTLNEEQLVALKHINGPVLVTAGAGSGKTRLLTHRIVYLMEHFAIAPQNILAITFTNKAANEMKERIAKLSKAGKDVWISTFHSMCVRILRQDIASLDSRFNSNFSIYSDTESTKVVKTLLAEENISDDKLTKNILFHLSNMKNNNVQFEKYKQEISYDRNAQLICKVMAAYQQKLVENNALDFDDLLMKTYELFVKCPQIKDFYATRFKYILVDEFQDTNVLQYDLVKLLASVHGNVFVVGDEDQCIYTWRGANFKNIANFKNDFAGTKVYKLQKNYRSTKTILDTANKLIKHNTQRIDKTLWCDNEVGEPIVYRTLYDEQAEADFVASTILNLVKTKGYCFGDFAILLRLNALSFPFEEKLLAYNIPHKIFGGFKFYERAEIKNVLAYLKLFVNPKDEQAFVRIINFPKRGIGDTSIEKIRVAAFENHVSALEVALCPKQFELPNALCQKLQNFAETYMALLNTFETSPLDEFANDVVEQFQIKNAFNDKAEDDLDKLLNIDQLLYSIKTFAQQNPFDGLSEYLQSVSLISDMDSMDESDNVIVATVHAVKGLEFRAVFLAGVEEGVFPISRAQGNDEDMEEERRLMYVGITRAKEKLFVSNATTRYLYGKRNRMLESRFVADANLAQQRPSFAQTFDRSNAFSGSTNKNVFSQVGFIKSSLSGNTDNKPTGNLPFKVGQKVVHKRFGQGKILEIDFEERTGDIDFDQIGVKTLMLDIAPLTIVE